MIKQLLTLLALPALSFAAALPTPKAPTVEVRRNILTPTDSPFYTRIHHLHVNGLHIGSLGWSQHIVLENATEIDYFYIHPKFRGKKAGSLLLNDALDRMRNQKYAAATLTPSPIEYEGDKVPTNAEEGIQYTQLVYDMPCNAYIKLKDRLLKFYGKHGFAKDPKHDFHYIRYL